MSRVSGILPASTRDQPAAYTMDSIKSIEAAIEALPASELAEFRAWFAEFDAAAWDRQIEHDASAGKLDDLMSEALADLRAGPEREL